MGPNTDVATLDVTGQQADAVDHVIDWFDHGDQQVFRLFGYAGTGKTTLARIIVDALDLNRVCYAAFTGKAAYVLRNKGAGGASTVHSLIYTPVEKARDKLDELKKTLTDTEDSAEQAVLRVQIRREEDKLATPGFVLKEDSDLEDADLCVLDEVSMVGTGMAHDLLSFGTKLLVLGDPAQLPPVDGGGYFINHAPDHLLTEIHRSAADSPVTRLATAVRSSPPGDRDLGIPGLDGESGRRPRVGRDQLTTFDQVLVGTNKTRWVMVHTLRGLFGLSGAVPQPGDRIMVLANNAEACVFNGQQFTVGAAHPDEKSPDVLHMLVFDDDEQPRLLDVWACGFEDLDGEKLAKRHGRSRIVAATFGQAITVHKAQGSQWRNVLVVDESRVFGHIAQKEHASLGAAAAAIEAHVAARRWLYTAVSRASDRVVIIPR